MSIATAEARIDPSRFRAVMRHLPTGVAAVCSTDPESGRPAGLIVGTFASLSLEPAWVTFNVARTSTSWPVIGRSRRFSVSLLADGQQHVCSELSKKNDDKFQHLDWELSPYGTPRIRGTLGWIDCTLLQEIDGGDHVLVIARVEEMAAADGGDPLVFHGGRLGSFRESG